MQIKDLVHEAEEATASASNLSRHLAFAGIAVIWTLSHSDLKGCSLQMLLRPLALFVIGLTLDYLQYIYKAILWPCLNKHYFKKYKNNDEAVEISESVNFPVYFLFYVKIACVIWGYGYLIYFIASQWPF